MRKNISKKTNKVSKGGKKTLIVGNWKMGPESPDIAKTLFQGIRKIAKAAPRVKTIICPPFLYTTLLAPIASKDGIALGAQDIFYKADGHYTGEVSVSMVKNSGAQYVIVGHSERRNLGEDAAILAQKVSLALKAGLSVIFCVGEQTRDTHGAYLEIVRAQIKESLGGIDSKLITKVIIAYEPVWAIGAKEAMNPSQIHEMAIYVKKVLREMYDDATVRATKVLYGGSVTTANTFAILKEGEVDGLLIGRQSLDVQDFDQIITTANEM